MFIYLTHVVNCFSLKYSSQSQSPSRQLPRRTHSSQTVKTDSGMESTLWLLQSMINTHKPFSASVPESPEQIFKLFSNHNLHMASEKHICQKDRMHVDCCHLLIIKPDETAIGVGANSQAHFILHDSG